MNTGYTSLTKHNQQSVKELRDEMEKIRQRAQLLAEPDRTFVTMYLDNDNTFGQMAKLAGLSRSTVARRIRKIIRRLGDEKLYSILSGNILTRKQKKIARDYYLRTMTLKDTAKTNHISYYKARKVVKRIRKILHQQHKTTVRSY